MFSSELLLRISKEVGAPVARVETTIKLLEEGATVPFIARYRKEATGNLEDVKVRDIDEQRQYYAELEARRATILNSIEKQEKLKYEMYYDFQETVAKIPSHRMLAIRRGTREGILNFSIDVDNTKFIVTLLSRIIRDPQSRFAPFLDTAVRDAYDRLLLPSIQNEVRSILKENAQSEAIKVVEDNLRTLLLAPPAGHLPVTGIDRGQRTGYKVAVVDETGKFLENQTIYPTEPKQDFEGSEKTLLDLTQKYNVCGIAIGN